ncbi:MAG TPA: hypothetical protein VFK92_04290 [Burkholderiales bacterium]|nr:hypothetical protein [Burkholderiales bacterium]
MQRGYFGAGVAHANTGFSSCVYLTECSVSGTRRGEKVSGGIRTNDPKVAFEGSIADLGTISKNWTDVDLSAHSDTKRVVVALGHLVGTVPITEQFGVLGRIGAGLGHRDIVTGLGTGVKYDLSQKAGVWVEYERYFNFTEGPSFHTDLFSASMVWYFR